MAFLILDDRTAVTVPYKTAKMLLAIKQGQLHGTPEQKAKAKRVSKFYMGKQHLNEQPKREVEARLPYKDL